METMESLDDTMDSPTTGILEIVKLLAEEEDMKVTAFGTKKGLSILVACVLVGLAIVQPLAWGLAAGLVIGSILVTFVCWEQKSVAEVIANMPREKQMELIQKILSTGIELSKLTPTSWLLGAPVLEQDSQSQGARSLGTTSSLGDGKRSKRDGKPYDGQTVTLPNGKVATREEVLLALRDCLVKDMRMSVY